MQALLAPLQELAEYGQAREDIRRGKTPVALSGCVDSQKLHMIYGLSEGIRYKVIVTYSDLKARELYEEYRFYDRNTLLYPAKDLIFFQADIHGNQLTRERVRVLRRIAEGKPLTLITTFAALMTPQVQWNPREDILTVENGGIVEETALAARLVALGYEKTYQVESSGQFSIRGGIVDIYDLTEENPYRIELWGDQVESIRSFDVLSQRSIEKLESITIYPAAEFIMDRDRLEQGVKRIEAEAKAQEKKLREAFETEAAHRISTQLGELKEQLLELGAKVNLESYIRYFYQDTVTLPELLQRMEEQSGRQNLVFFLDEPARIAEHADAVELEFRESMEQRARKGYVLPGQMDILYSREQVMARCLKSAVVSLATMDGKNSLIRPVSRMMVSARNVSSYNNSFEALVKDLTRYRKQGYRVLLLSGSRTRAKRLAEDLREYELTAVYTEDPFREIQPGEVLTYYGHVNKGFEYPLIKYVVIAESDIFGAEKKKKKKKRYQGQKINDFNELKVGDYVVHETHGLGIYRGIEKVEVEKVVKDYMKIEYRDGGNLYVLATGLDVIQKYASAEGSKPKLNKLGTREWERTKTKVRSAVDEVAGDLVELYALRQQSQGYQFGQDTVWQREFEEMFPFEETEDQLTAIADTKADMESSKIMDRLICG
ncbi:MAG: transcription-repair coupling factor, partial [Lachnospiraceae bacterium]|nr:transcription-repair coupling factor [Lachnospiraceae bacterium]